MAFQTHWRKEGRTGYLVAAATAAATHLRCGGEANLWAPEVAARGTSWELFCDRGQRKPRSQVGDIKGGGGGRRRVGGGRLRDPPHGAVPFGGEAVTGPRGRAGAARWGCAAGTAEHRRGEVCRVWGGERRGGLGTWGRKEDGGCLGWVGKNLNNPRTMIR